MKNPNKVVKNNWRVTPQQIVKVKKLAKHQKKSESQIVREILEVTFK